MTMIDTPRGPMEEIDALRTAIVEAKRRLDFFRETNNELQIDLTEADIDGMLDRIIELQRAAANEH